MGVSREGCSLILKCLRLILELAASLQASRGAQSFKANHVDPIPTTLPTVLQYLGLQDGLDFYVVCPKCDTLYKEDTPANIPDQCIDDGLGAPCEAELFSEKYRGNRTWRKALRNFSHELFETWLARFLNRHDIEDMLTMKPAFNGQVRTDVWEASYMSTFPGGGQPCFFDCPSGELRLGFLLYHDFFNPYTNKMAGKKRSIGLIMMVCLNLPPDVRYDMKNIYVTAMIPGPKEPTMENINKFLRPIVDNLLEHYDPGVFITKTHRYPQGRKVRSAVTISSLDIVACRAFAGLGSHSHTCFCSFCTAILSQIDNFDLSDFSERSFEEYRNHVERWLNAANQKERQELWSRHGIRYTEWSRHPWWNPFTDSTIAPLHWIKNSAEKLIRENMGCSTTMHAGIPSIPPPLSRPITTVEVTWGLLALSHLDEPVFLKTNFPEPLLRFLCRDKSIFEAGVSSDRMIKDLSKWVGNNMVSKTLQRRKNRLVKADGTAAHPERDNEVSLAKAEYYLSRAGKEVTSSLNTHTTVPVLQALCDKFKIARKPDSKKADLMKRLVDYYSKNVTIVPLPLPARPKNEGPLLGLEVVAEIKADMQRTNIPSWLKKPPLNFATIDHGKLASEEYKSLTLISLPITLIRLWSSKPELREYLDNFLHFSIAVRLHSYQSLTDRDESLFERHYQEYVDKLKTLYPFNSITPVQHLGLHIPYFMRKLGPSTRYTENTCEMFIGMLEDISTNSRIGELEQTLHRELIMAANLGATMSKWGISGVLKPLADLIRSFLDKRYASGDPQPSATWITKHKNNLMTLDQATYGTLSMWAHNNNQTRGFARQLHICDELRYGHVVYQPFTGARNNSGISFRPRGVFHAVPGRIDAILQEPSGVDGAARIIILARAYNPLSTQDAANDIYRNHPLVGEAHLNIMRLFYDTMDLNNVHILEPEDIVSHIVACSFVDTDRKMSEDCVVILDIDMVRDYP
ncbi:hypothetical protein FRC09_011093 [Ceratobasidium sp. 395]|nr:hypothetical protein FRC09_011093 [Ceratobasidium sp. 395]